MIHITNGRTDDIIGFFTQKDTTFNEHTQNLETYQDSFEFTSFGDHKYAHTLTDMNRVIIPAEDGGYSEYVINTARKSRNRSNLVRVKSFASYQMLSVAKVIRPTSLSAYTPSQVLGFITNDTEWRPGITESNATRTFHVENHTDRLSFLKTVANEFELEIRFRVETDGKRVTGRFIDLLERVGDWRGREITFGKDLESIERTEEFGNIYTKLICLGPEDEDGNRLIVEVEDDDALRRWGRPHPITGELMHLEDTYEPTSDRSDMTEAELRRYGRTELNKRINSSVTYEAEVVDLENVPGMANKKIRFGDTVRIKDEKFNPPLYVEARIFEQRRDIFTKSNKKVKLGDFIEYTEEELRAVIDRLSKQIQSKISQAELIEYTYSKIEIDDKDEYFFDEGKTFAEAVGIEAEDNAKEFAVEEDNKVRTDAQDYASEAERLAKQYAEAQAELERLEAEAYTDGEVSKEKQARIKQAEANLAVAEARAELAETQSKAYADGIVSDEEQARIADAEVKLQEAKEYAEQQDENLKSEVEGYADQVAEDRSNEALQQALAQSVAQEAYDTKMQEIANDLSEKAGVEYVDGQIQVIDGVIDDLNVEIDTKADGSTVYTISDVDNMINNTVSLTQYTTDIDGIVSDLSDQSAQIGQNHEAIGLKANQTDLDTVAGTVSDHSAQFLTMADEISARVTAEYVQTAIDDVEIGSRNLIRNSNFTDGLNHWRIGNGGTREVVNSEKFGKALKVFKGTIHSRSADTPLEDNQTYTTSLWLKSDVPMTVSVGIDGGGSTYATSFDIDEEWKLYSFTRHSTRGNNVLRIYEYTGNADFYVANVKIEKGNKATDWTPAPEDIDAEISSLSAELSVQAGIVSAKADSTTVNALGTRVSTAETKISGLEGEITSKVSTTQFNTLSGTVSTLSTTVSQQATQISSKVDDGDVRSIFTQEAGSFTFQANQINFDGHVFGENATYSGTVDIGNTTIDEFGILTREGEFRIIDSETQGETSIRSLSNMVNDHSFELVPLGQGTWSHAVQRVDHSKMLNFYNWTIEGSKDFARIQSTLDTNDYIRAKHGLQAAILESRYYWVQYLTLDIDKTNIGPYTISAYFSAYEDTSEPTECRVLVHAYDVDLNLTQTSSVGGFYITVNPNEPYRWKRVSHTFRNLPDGTVYLRIRIDQITGDQTRALCDGVQMVPLEYPTTYQPEDSLWKYIQGVVGYS